MPNVLRKFPFVDVLNSIIHSQTYISCNPLSQIVDEIMYKKWSILARLLEKKALTTDDENTSYAGLFEWYIPYTSQYNKVSIHHWICGTQCGSHKSNGRFENEMCRIYNYIISRFVEILILTSSYWDVSRGVDQLYNKFSYKIIFF